MGMLLMVGHLCGYAPYGGTPVWVWVCLIPPDSGTLCGYAPYGGTPVWVWVCLIPPDSGTCV